MGEAWTLDLQIQSSRCKQLGHICLHETKQNTREHELVPFYDMCHAFTQLGYSERLWSCSGVWTSGRRNDDDDDKDDNDHDGLTSLIWDEQHI